MPPREPEPHDPRLHLALKGMVIVPDEGILILDKTLSELSGVEGRRIGEVADRKKISSHTLRSQVIDFNCDLVISKTGNQGGGHDRKGYTRAAAIS